MAYLLVAHDLATVRYLSHRLVVMYLGEIVEAGLSEAVFTKPLHPYTQALISAALPARPGGRSTRVILTGDLPSPTNPPPGCRFHTRCPMAFERLSRRETWGERTGARADGSLSFVLIAAHDPGHT